MTSDHHLRGPRPWPPPAKYADVRRGARSDPDRPGCLQHSTHPQGSTTGLAPTVQPTTPQWQYNRDPRKCEVCRKFWKATRRCGHNTPTTDLAVLTCIIPQASSLKPVVLQGRFGDRQVSMLVDTGAAVSIVHKSMVAHGDKVRAAPGLTSLIFFRKWIVQRLSGAQTTFILPRRLTV